MEVATTRRVTSRRRVRITCSTRPAARLDIIGRQEIVRAATRETSTTSRALVQARAHGGRSGRPPRRRPMGTAERRFSAIRGPGDTPRPGLFGSTATQARGGEPGLGFRSGALLPGRKSSGPFVHPDRYPGSRCSRRSSARGMPPRLFSEVRAGERRAARFITPSPRTRATPIRLPLRAGGRRHRPVRRGGRDDRTRVLHRIASETVPADELEKARALAKGRFVLRLEEPRQE